MVFRSPKTAAFTAALAICLASACGAPHSITPPDGGSGSTCPSRIDPALKPSDLVLKAKADPPSPALPAGVTVRALTMNIYGNHLADPAAIGAFLKTQNADIIGLQECDEMKLPAIAEAAGYQYFAGRGQCSLSRTPILDFHWESTEWGRELAHYETGIGGIRFSVYNAHTSWNTAGDKQCRWMIDDVFSNDPNPYKLMTGDFNDEELSSQITILDEQLRDVFTAIGLYPGERISWPSTGFDDTEGSQLIDLIFTPRSSLAIVLRADVLNVVPVLSDHKPATAEILYQYDSANPAPDPLTQYRDVWRDLPAESGRPPNLLVNPGAESGLEGWTCENGASSAAEREHVKPRTGSAFFTGYRSPEEGLPHISSCSQTVELSPHAAAIDSGLGVLYVSGFITTGYQTEEKDGIVSNVPKPYDEGEVVVETLCSCGNVLSLWNSKRRDTLKWHPFAAAIDLPPGARTARVTWVSHQKPGNGSSNDAAFDDLYLGYADLKSPGRIIGADMLSNPGAETGGAEGWKSYGWKALTDGEAYGYSVFTNSSFSGAHYFFAGGLFGSEGGKPGLSTLSQKITLEGWRNEIASGMAIRWGGALRTWDGSSTIVLELAIYDGDGSEWGRVRCADIDAPEWTRAECLTRVPPGASAAAIILSTDVSNNWTASFADGLYAAPERL